MLRSVALSAATPTGLGQSAIYAVLGYAVVFIGLVLLMAVIVLMGKAMARKAAPAPASAPAAPAPAAPVRTGPPAPGSAGDLTLYEVSEKEAAMLMAIVADQMGKPLNELRFKSIKEVK